MSRLNHHNVDYHDDDAPDPTREDLDMDGADGGTPSIDHSIDLGSNQLYLQMADPLIRKLLEFILDLQLYLSWTKSHIGDLVADNDLFQSRINNLKTTLKCIEAMRESDWRRTAAARSHEWDVNNRLRNENFALRVERNGQQLKYNGAVSHLTSEIAKLEQQYNDHVQNGKRELDAKIGRVEEQARMEIEHLERKPDDDLKARISDLRNNKLDNRTDAEAALAEKTLEIFDQHPIHQDLRSSREGLV